MWNVVCLFAVVLLEDLIRFLEIGFSFLSCRASDKCQKEKRKTINGDDLLWAMATLGFEDYIDPLKAYLMRYREVRFLSLLAPPFL